MAIEKLVAIDTPVGEVSLRPRRDGVHWLLTVEGRINIRWLWLDRERLFEIQVSTEARPAKGSARAQSKVLWNGFMPGQQEEARIGQFPDGRIQIRLPGRWLITGCYSGGDKLELEIGPNPETSR